MAEPKIKNKNVADIPMTKVVGLSDEIEAIKSAVSSYVSITGTFYEPYTAILTNAENIEPYYTKLKADNTDILRYVIPLNSEVEFPIGSRIIIRQNTDNVIKIDVSDGVSCDIVQTVGYGSVVMLEQVETDVWYAMGGIESYDKETIVYPDITNSEDNNALSDWEANNITAVSVSNATREVETTDLPEGTYACKIITSNGTSGNLAEPVNTESGETYKVSFWAKNGTDAAGRLVLWQGVTTSPDEYLTSDWVFYEHEVEATSTTITPRVYIYPTSESGYILIKGLKVIKL